MPLPFAFLPLTSSLAVLSRKAFQCCSFSQIMKPAFLGLPCSLATRNEEHHNQEHCHSITLWPEGWVGPVKKPDSHGNADTMCTQKPQREKGFLSHIFKPREVQDVILPLTRVLVPVLSPQNHRERSLCPCPSPHWPFRAPAPQLPIMVPHLCPH